MLSQATHVAGVSGALNIGFERWLVRLGHQLLEVDMCRKERVALDVLSSIRTETLRWIPGQQPGQDRPGFWAEFVTKLERIGQNLVACIGFSDMIHGVSRSSGPPLTR